MLWLMGLMGVMDMVSPPVLVSSVALVSRDIVTAGLAALGGSGKIFLEYWSLIPSPEQKCD